MNLLATFTTKYTYENYLFNRKCEKNDKNINMNKVKIHIRLQSIIKNPI